MASCTPATSLIPTAMLWERCGWTCPRFLRATRRADRAHPIRQALKGRDAVVSALGTPASPFREVTLLSTATHALASAMKVEHVSRLVCITGIGAGDSAGHGGFLFDNLIFPLLLRKVYADKNRQETIVRDSGLDWVLVRPSVLTDKPSRDTI